MSTALLLLFSALALSYAIPSQFHQSSFPKKQYETIPLEVPDSSFDEDESSLRIVNGKEAGKNAYPFLVRLTVIWGSDGGLCGATILNKNYVITAAHCFFHPDTGAFAERVLLTMGDHRKSVQESSEVRVYGSNIMLYGYDESTHYNDIAIIEVSQGIAFTPQIQPACMVSSGSDNTGQLAKAAGWGALGSGRETSDVLLQVDIPVLDDSKCKNSYRNMFYPDVMVCGGYTDGTKDTCQGDSGGPLFYSKNNKFTVIGLTSFGYGCATRGFPGVYTRVAAFSDFITETAGSVCFN